MNPGDDPKILVVNPGSTSTRVSLFLGEAEGASVTLPAPVSGSPVGLWDEFPARLEGIRDWMKREGIHGAELSAVVGRGGLLRPLEGGAYSVNEAMLADARGNRRGTHASNLGCALAQALADHATRAAVEARPPTEGENGAASEPGKVPFQTEESGCVPAFIVDPVSTDEFEELARISGLKGVERISLSHALSIHALVQEVCRREERPVEGSRFVVAHLGGGISVCPVSSGRIIDANNANSGGPFSPTRAGGLPTQGLMDLCLSGDHTASELREMTVKRGGLVSYLGTDDARIVEERIAAGDQEALMVFEAMGYQIAKEIGAMATVLEGSVEKVLLTGGLASSGLLVGWVRERVSFIGPVEVWPEVGEMRALALGALGVLRGEQQAKEY